MASILFGGWLAIIGIVWVCVEVVTLNLGGENGCETKVEMDCISRQSLEVL